ncbi:ABC transporter ATP-binding protein [Aurantivibrio infirmus]
MSALVSAKNLTKKYGKTTVLDGIDLEIEPGKIVGLIGHNGAGKTTALKCILGLAPCEGELSVLGMEPNRNRAGLMEKVCFIADTAILPRWITPNKSLDFMDAIHPKFNRKKAEMFLQKTDIKLDKTVGKLSKGMITQLHLALIMAIDVPLLVLDEPTLGLDILYRKQFYTSLLNDYFDQEKTILITTHQVEEIETILTDLVFIRDGKIVLNSTMEEVAENFTEVSVGPDLLDEARKLNPIYENSGLGKTEFIFENLNKKEVAQFGEVRSAKIADLFVAKMQ